MSISPRAKRSSRIRSGPRRLKVRLPSRPARTRATTPTTARANTMTMSRPPKTPPPQPMPPSYQSIITTHLRSKHYSQACPRRLVLVEPMAPAVRGHEKVPTGGQVEVPGGGQVVVPAPRVSCPGPVALCGDGVGANQITGHRTGASIEEREGTDGRIGRLPGGGQLPGCRAVVRHDAQDGQADRGATQRRPGRAPAAGEGAQLRPGGRVGRRSGATQSGTDLGEAAAAGGTHGGL